MTSTHMYTVDNRDFYPPNPDDGNTVQGHNWCPGHAGVGDAEEFNSTILADPTRALLAIYTGKNVKIYKCPADLRSGGTPRQPAARTFSMSQAVGTICPGFNAGTGHSGAPTLPVNGPWLNNNHDHKRENPYHTYGKASAVAYPGPAMVFTYIDEDANSLNDGGFAVGMAHAEWIDWPGTYHNNACGFAFLDGHSEIHKWKSRYTNWRSWPPNNISRRAIPDGTANVDWQWITQHTSGR